MSRRLVPPRPARPEHWLPLWRFFPRLIDNPLKAWPEDAYRAPIVVRRRRGKPVAAYLADPEGIERVLKRKTDLYAKSPLQNRFLRPLLGDGLLTVEGDAWRHQRHVAAPMFQRKRLMGFVPVMAELTAEHLRDWAAPSPRPRDMDAEMMALTLKIIARTMFSRDAGGDVGLIAGAIDRYRTTGARPGLADILGLPRWVPRLGLIRARGALETVQRVTERILSEREIAGDRPDDLLTRLIDARDPETGAGFSRREILDNIATFILAGHDTTANALTWTLYLLARDAECAARVRAEADRVLGDGHPGADDVDALVYTRQVVEEAMRLYPPVPALVRKATADDELAGEPIPAGTQVFILPWIVHRHHDLWEAPEAFDPDRFAEDRKQAMHRYQYLPFGAGPRICIGAAFAMIEAVVLLAMIVQRFELAADETHPVEPLGRITLKARYGMPLTPVPRRSQPGKAA